MIPDTPLNVAIVLLLSEWAKQEDEYHHHIGKLRLLMNNLAFRFRETLEVEKVDTEQLEIEFPDVP